MKKKILKIERTNKLNEEKIYGISTRSIAPSFQMFFYKNKFVMDICDNDMAILYLYRFLHRKQLLGISQRLYYNRYLNKVSTYKNIKEDFNKIKWNCSICDKKIISVINSQVPSNFCCKECKKNYLVNKDIIDARIVQGSLKFMEYIKTMYSNEAKIFLKHQKKNTKKEKKV